MEFPSLFPQGAAMFKQPHFQSVDLHKYALHLLRYYDNRFGFHPRFRYYLYNLIMRRHSQSIAAIFIKKNIEDNFPTTISELNTRLEQTPSDNYQIKSCVLVQHSVEHALSGTNQETN